MSIAFVARIFICRARTFVYFILLVRFAPSESLFVSEIYRETQEEAEIRHIVSVFSSSSPPRRRLIGSPPAGVIPHGETHNRALLNESGICSIFETSPGYCVASHRLCLLSARTMKQRRSQQMTNATVLESVETTDSRT